MKIKFDQLSTKDFILIKGAEMHNLQQLDVAIPRNKLIVVTGVSGSGKSSLAFDTLYADGQRRYVESLSAYARQFLDRMVKPKVEYIKGISPAIAIEQKVNKRNPRSTVGTSTEIYEYLKLLYARIGKTYSPKSGELVKKDTVKDVIEYLKKKPNNTKAMIFSKVQKPEKRTWQAHFNILIQQGFSRVKIGEEMCNLHDLIDNQEKNYQKVYLVIDRVMINEEQENLSRIAESVETAFYEGRGNCSILTIEDGQEIIKEFSNKFEKDNILFEEPSPNFFSFNNPFGACKTCGGLGETLGYDLDLIIPDKSLSVYEGTIACWRGEKLGKWKDRLIQVADKFDFPIHRPYYELSDTEKRVLQIGNQYFQGIDDFFKEVESQTYKIQYRVLASRYRGKSTCPDCRGTRLREDTNYVKINQRSIIDLLLISIDDLLDFFTNIELSTHEKNIAERLILEITNRLRFLHDVGLGYLTLNRLSKTLSGGESQRINLATSLGSSLVGSLYILDEPSIGLHPRDTQKLLSVLERLRDLGNTVIVVEHEEDIIRAADQIIDIGPLAGKNGGKLVFQGTQAELRKDKENLTAAYLTGRKEIPIPESRRKWRNYIEIIGAHHHNLKGFNVKFPLNTFTCVTGVSGSGKTSLVKGILYPALKKIHGGYGEKTGDFDRLQGEYNAIRFVELVDQNPIGKSSRSNPATYTKAFDEIRALFAAQKLAQLHKYKPGFFSFNVLGGRCETCQGEGEVTVEMQFMADIHLTCENCKGSRFKTEALQVKYNGKSIYDVLEMTVDEAINFFSTDKETNTVKKILRKLQPLSDVGMGYVQLGQSASTLSGGEAQRIKLASFLNKGNNEEPGLFIFDEPTTGLHFHDINKLINSLNALIDKGHSVIVIEHNMNIIKSADWIIDLGPEGGEKGGNLIFEGTPEALAKSDTYTAIHLKEKL